MARPKLADRKVSPDKHTYRVVAAVWPLSSSGDDDDGWVSMSPTLVAAVVVVVADQRAVT